MTPSDREAAGRQIARARRRRGLSQAVLAGLVGRSESWLSQVERGKRGVDRFRQAHPAVVIGAGNGWWQAVIPAPDGEIVTTRYTLRALLDKLDELLRANPGRTWNP